jgi:hypothetical protein
VIAEIYNTISLKTLESLQAFSTSDLIKLLFELSQKKSILPFFVKDERI